jgi:hypothetical protein
MREGLLNIPDGNKREVTHNTGSNARLTCSGPWTAEVPYLNPVVLTAKVASRKQGWAQTKGIEFRLSIYLICMCVSKSFASRPSLPFTCSPEKDYRLVNLHTTKIIK